MLTSLYKIVVRERVNYKVIQIHEVYEKRVGLEVDKIIDEFIGQEISIQITKLS